MHALFSPIPTTNRPEIALLFRLKSTHPSRSFPGKPPPSPCHPGPGFPASRCWQGPRVRFSFKENRMQFIGATGIHRKSGGAPEERSGVSLRLSEIPLGSGLTLPNRFRNV
jgi:hypothetical protein